MQINPDKDRIRGWGLIRKDYGLWITKKGLWIRGVWGNLTLSMTGEAISLCHREHKRGVSLATDSRVRLARQDRRRRAILQKEHQLWLCRLFFLQNPGHE